MHITILLPVFGLIFLGELPDKTMFASLVLATRGRPLWVWTGAAGAFVVHVAIAVTVGVAVFRVLPGRAVDAVVAFLFAAGAVYAWLTRNQAAHPVRAHAASGRARTAVTALGVLFVAEWGDLTQVLTANLALRYHSPLSVAVGSVLALWAVAAIAVLAAPRLLYLFPAKAARILGAVVLGGLAVADAVRAATS
ncbi:MAG TPA: TMEM165/GDT1 family protein [Acidimicrobiales bacterium]|nr:TMEM165/GDT1 family protein [Acidimicrobiales bacterium]